MGEIHARFQDVAGDVHQVRVGGALQGVDGQIEEDLDEIGAVDLQFDVLDQGVNLEGVVTLCWDGR